MLGYHKLLMLLFHELHLMNPLSSGLGGAVVVD